MRSWIRTVVSLVSVVILGFSAVAGQERTLVLEGGTLIDGTGKPAIPDAVVVVEGTRIKAVGARGRVQYPAGANVIRARWSNHPSRV